MKTNDGTINIIKKVTVSKNFQIHYTIDVYEGEELDTQVNIFPAWQNSHIMTIAGNTRKQFEEEFINLINKYKI